MRLRASVFIVHGWVTFHRVVLIQCFFQVLHTYPLVAFGAVDVVVAGHVLYFDNVLLLDPKTYGRASDVE